MKKNIIPLRIKMIAIPVGSLLILIVISIFAFKTGFFQVSEQRAKLEQSRKNEKILSAKIDLLSGIESDVITQTNLVVAALSDKNPSLLALSQIRNLAGSQGIFLSNVKIGSGGTAGSGGLSGVNITFDILGETSSLLNLISAIKQIAPITHVTKAVFSFSDAGTQATVSVKTYWAGFPTKISSILDPSSPLNENEKKTLDAVSGLSIPALVNLAPTEPFERMSPFGD